MTYGNLIKIKFNMHLEVFWYFINWEKTNWCSNGMYAIRNLWLCSKTSWGSSFFSLL